MSYSKGNIDAFTLDKYGVELFSNLDTIYDASLNTQVFSSFEIYSDEFSSVKLDASYSKTYDESM